jgi:pentatricopeptide repeat protein
MYAKCGSMEDAWRVFNKMPSRNVVVWNAILGGCAVHGQVRKLFTFPNKRVKKAYNQTIAVFCQFVGM